MSFRRKILTPRQIDATHDLAAGRFEISMMEFMQSRKIVGCEAQLATKIQYTLHSLQQSFLRQAINGQIFPTNYTTYVSHFTCGLWRIRTQNSI
jgi:hypothetical protein